MDPALIDAAASKIPVLGQWPAVLVLIVTGLLVALVFVSARLARAAYAVANSLGGMSGKIDGHVDAIRSDIQGTTRGVQEMGHKLDRNTDLVNQATRDHFDRLVAEIKMNDDERMAKLRVDLDRVYPPSNGDRMAGEVKNDPGPEDGIRRSHPE